MNRHKIQKVSRALVATTLATGSVAFVTTPLNPPVEAAAFKDLPPTSIYYASMYSLVARNVLKGYSDGTIRPNISVTRGQVAKIIALALKINTSNVVNPKYKDISKSHPYYKYIAALSAQGIINGFADNSFRPNEAVTRGQISKILVKAYKFEQATQVADTFRDVNKYTSNALAIQTLLNLKVTSGTSPVKFSPNSRVTRGQLALLIINSENAKSVAAVTPKITNIAGTTMYLNGVPYQIDEELQNIFNEDNKNVLMGATIEGKFSGSNLVSISKVTLNASGTSSDFLVFEGNFETFAANIDIKGNYIRFENFDLTGTVTVSDTIRKTLNNYTALLPKIYTASLNQSFGFINWTTTPNNMTTVNKSIEFTNTTVAKLNIAQDKTKIVSNYDLTDVSVVADVREIDLQSYVNVLSVNKDVPVTVYGKGDIKRTNYISVTDVNLYIDGNIATLAVDNKFGWIDLGPDTTVSKVILPAGTSPNDVFSDYLVDYTNITKIEDPTGKPIDKNPIENQQPIDKTAPVISNVTVTSLSEGQAQVDFTVNEAGNYYYIIKEKGDVEPTLKDIVKGPPSPPPVQDGVGTYMGTGRAYVGSNSFTAKDLKEKTDYVLYLVAVDGRNNVSAPKTTKEFYTKDSLPPTIGTIALEPLVGGQRMKFSFTATEPGDYYYYFIENSGSRNPAIDAKYVIENAKGTGKVTSSNQKIEYTITGLKEKTYYQVYAILKDTSGNISDVAYNKDLTKELDNIAPYVVDAELLPVNGKKNQFTFRVSEKLDPITANEPSYYLLSGTAIINASGQSAIAPEAVSYQDSGSGGIITITVPASTAFVNNDTLNVTVSDKVKDLADIAFENYKTENLPVQVPRNVAKYRYTDNDLYPKITIKNPVFSPDGKTMEADFGTTKAGTLHYVIMKSDLNTSTWLPRDIVERTLPNSQQVEFISYGGNIPLEFGTQKLDVPIIGNFNPFYSYSMYVVLRDRSGFYSNIVEQVLVKDSTPPTLTSPLVKPQPGDTTANFEFGSNEKGTMHYILKKKGELEPTLDELKAAPAEPVQETGTNIITLTGLTPKSEYVLYYISNDTVGNWLKTGGVEKVNSIPFYSDGTKPTIANGNVLYKVTEGGQDYYDITFSEAIDTSSFDASTDLTIVGTGGATLASTSWSDGNTKLRLKFSGPIASDVTVTVKDGSITDVIPTTTPPVVPPYQINAISAQTATYKYPGAGINNILRKASLAGTITDVAGTKVSDQINVLVDIGAPLGFEQKYYYVVLNSAASTDITPEQIIQTVETTVPTASGVTQFGSAVVNPADASGASFLLPLFANQINGSTATRVFIEGHRVFLLTIDKYGNIIFAKDGSDLTKNYIEIK